MKSLLYLIEEEDRAVRKSKVCGEVVEHWANKMMECQDANSIKFVDFKAERDKAIEKRDAAIQELDAVRRELKSYLVDIINNY